MDRESAKKQVASLFKVEVYSSNKNSKVVIRSEKKSSRLARWCLTLDKDLSEAKVPTPSGWKVDVKDKTVTFTATKPLKASKSVTFGLPIVNRGTPCTCALRVWHVPEKDT